MKATPLRSSALPWLEAVLLVALVGVSAYWCLVVREGLSEPDTLFHFRLAQMILQDGPWVDVPWLPFTVLGERGPDHQWLWHVALAPFTLIPDPQQAIAVAGAVTCAAVALVAWLVCRRFAIPLAVVFALLFVCIDVTMPERLTRLRSENVVCMMLPVALLLMARRQRIALFVLSFVFMASYHGAILLIPLAAVFTIASLVTHRPESLHGAIAVGAGIAAALLISPWFPQNFDYFLFHTLFKLQSGNTDLIGTEWRSPSWAHVWKLSTAPTLLLSCAVALFGIRRFRTQRTLRLAEETIAALLMTGVLFAMYLTAYRYGVYYAAFAVLASGLLWRDAAVRIERPRLRIGAGLAAAGAAVAIFGLRVQTTITDFPVEIRSMTRFASIASYLADRTRPGDVVFNVNWDSFPYLMWQAPQLRYVAGLDGNYLAFGDPDRFKTWYAIYQGKTIEGGASRRIREQFGAQWVVVPRSEHYDRVAMGIIDGGEARTMMFSGDGWLIHLGPDTPAAVPAR